MEYVNLGKSGLKVSIIGLGAWQASGKAWGADVEDENIVKAIKRAYELGINFIDTAEAYGNGHSEEVVGKAVKEIGRENLVIATKVHGAHLRYNELLKAAEHSLKRLGIKEIDLYQVHWPDPWEQIPLKHTMRAMEQLYKEGKIRAIGVSNFAVRDLEEARKHLSVTDIVSNQVRYNMLQREIEEEVLPYCKKENISIIAWSPIAQGALTGKYNISNKPSDDVRRGNRLFSDRNLREISKLIPVLEKIAKARNKTVAQVALNWLLREGNVIPIPGAKNPKQAEENAGAADWRLSSQELKEIEDALSKISLDYF
ncbi:MAG: aldo/keto reductase [Thermoproteota archaeon]|jgi:aryl-alcohol dehydrogenase-like predicted oxidoreductase